jgi:hypothetical protein
MKSLPPYHELRSLSRKVPDLGEAHVQGLKPFSPAQREMIDAVGIWSVRLVLLIGLTALAVGMVTQFDLVVRLMGALIVLALIGAVGLIRG